MLGTLPSLQPVRRVAHGDRGADQRAQAAVVVGDLDLPDPGRAAAAADRGRAVHVPSLMGRIRLALISCPIASLPSSLTPMPVPADVIVSASVRNAPPCTIP